MGKSRYLVSTPDGNLEEVQTLAEALQGRPDGGFAWLDFANPDAEDLTALVEPLGLHPLAIEDCLDEDQVPKLEEFPGHTFILFNRYQTDGDAATIEEVNFFLGASFLVTVHSHGNDSAAFGERLLRTARRDATSAGKGPDFLLQVLLDDIVDEKFDAIEALQDQLDTIEDDLLRSAAEFRPGRLVRLRRTLLYLRKSLVYEREILVKVCRRDSRYVTEAAIYDFRDIYDHLAKFFEVVEICRELIGSIMEIHLSMVNNQMTMVANRTNQIVRRLTLITTIFMPLTLLSGIGGMSEWSMMTGPENWRIAYPAFLGSMAAIAGLSFWLLKWAERRDKPMPSLYGADDDEPAPPH
jgi:magnesium transporter